MGRTGLALIAVLAVAVAAPQQVDAQGPPGQRQGQRERDIYRQDRNDRDIWDVILGRGSDSRSRARNSGPPFCQNGQGHPVHGRAWCYEKGFGLGRGGDLGDIIFRNSRRNGRLDQRGLIDVIGDVVFGRVQEQGRALGTRDPLYGTWYASPGGGQVLSIRAGDLIIAELIDQTLDGRVDQFRLRRRR